MPVEKPVAAKPQTKPAPAETKKPAKAAAKPAPPIPVTAPVKNAPPSAFKPLEAPPLPITATQKQQLDELLRKYRADEITPQQYHEERARILGLP
jgi:hypothetical protein